jgi:hypothetical protein
VTITAGVFTLAKLHSSSYMKNGIVNLLFENMEYTSIPSAVTLFTIDAGFRPASNTTMPVYNVTGLQVATVYIDASGATSNF